MHHHIAFILAQSASEPSLWTLGQMAFNFLIGLGMLWIGHKTKRIETLETEIKSATKTLIDAQLEVVVARFTGALQSLEQAIVRIDVRLTAGETEFRSLATRDQSNELKLMASVGELKDYIRDHCANKKDVQDLSRDLNAVKVALATRGE